MVLKLLPLFLLGCVSNGNGLARRTSDVSGRYALSFDDHDNFTVGTRKVAGGEKDMLNFGNDASGMPIVFDAGAFCATHVCPSQIFGSQILITQDSSTISVGNFSGTQTNTDSFSLQLGEAADCGALTTSHASGRFTHRGESPAGDGGVTRPADAPVDGIADGVIDLTFDCVGVEMTLGFSGSRLGPS
jgi:hypothetical protein